MAGVWTLRVGGSMTFSNVASYGSTWVLRLFFLGGLKQRSVDFSGSCKGW